MIDLKHLMIRGITPITHKVQMKLLYKQSTKTPTKKLKMPWGSTQAYQHSLQIFSY
jgi:hypothetical protein